MGVCPFTSYFITHHLDIVIDILQTLIHASNQQVWPDSGTGTLISVQAYNFLRSPLLQMAWAPWIWAPFISQLWSTTVWRAIWGKLPTSDVFHCIGHSGPTMCPLCTSFTRTQVLVLSECIFTRSIYTSICDIFNIQLSYDLGSLAWFLQAKQVAQSEQINNLWKLFLHHCMGYLVYSL